MNFSLARFELHRWVLFAIVGVLYSCKELDFPDEIGSDLDIPMPEQTSQIQLLQPGDRVFGPLVELQFVASGGGTLSTGLINGVKVPIHENVIVSTELFQPGPNEIAVEARFASGDVAAASFTIIYDTTSVPEYVRTELFDATLSTGEELGGHCVGSFGGTEYLLGDADIGVDQSIPGAFVVDPRTKRWEASGQGSAIARCSARGVTDALGAPVEAVYGPPSETVASVSQAQVVAGSFIDVNCQGYGPSGQPQGSDSSAFELDVFPTPSSIDQVAQKFQVTRAGEYEVYCLAPSVIDVEPALVTVQANEATTSLVVELDPPGPSAGSLVDIAVSAYDAYGNDVELNSTTIQFQRLEGGAWSGVQTEQGLGLNNGTVRTVSTADQAEFFGALPPSSFVIPSGGEWRIVVNGVTKGGQQVSANFDVPVTEAVAPQTFPRCLSPRFGQLIVSDGDSGAEFQEFTIGIDNGTNSNSNIVVRHNGEELPRVQTVSELEGETSAYFATGINSSFAPYWGGMSIIHGRAPRDWGLNTIEVLYDVSLYDEDGVATFDAVNNRIICPYTVSEEYGAPTDGSRSDIGLDIPFQLMDDGSLTNEGVTVMDRVRTVVVGLGSSPELFAPISQRLQFELQNNEEITKRGTVLLLDLRLEGDPELSLEPSPHFGSYVLSTYLPKVVLRFHVQVKGGLGLIINRIEVKGLEIKVLVTPIRRGRDVSVRYQALFDPGSVDGAVPADDSATFQDVTYSAEVYGAVWFLRGVVEGEFRGAIVDATATLSEDLARAYDANLRQLFFSNGATVASIAPIAEVLEVEPSNAISRQGVNVVVDSRVEDVSIPASDNTLVGRFFTTFAPETRPVGPRERPTRAALREPGSLNLVDFEGLPVGVAVTTEISAANRALLAIAQAGYLWGTDAMQYSSIPASLILSGLGMGTAAGTFELQFRNYGVVSLVELSTAGYVLADVGPVHMIVTPVEGYAFDVFYTARLRVPIRPSGDGFALDPANPITVVHQAVGSDTTVAASTVVTELFSSDTVNSEFEVGWVGLVSPCREVAIQMVTQQLSGVLPTLTNIQYGLFLSGRPFPSIRVSAWSTLRFPNETTAVAVGTWGTID